MENTRKKKLLIGFNTFCDSILSDDKSFVLPFSGGKGADFVVCHFTPKDDIKAEANRKAKAVAEKLSRFNVDFIANFEFQNWNKDCKSSDGVNYALENDGSHRLYLPDDYIDALGAGNNLYGLMYDEFEHAVLNRNLSITLGSKFKIKLPAFPFYKGRDVLKQGELLSKQLKEYVKLFTDKGKRLSGEHVFPVLFHIFAKNGIIPNFKSQKEGFSNIQFACAAGAALQYKMELWNCVDLWYRNTNPGHTPDEMYNNLLFSYYCGANRVYVESSRAFITDNKLNGYGKEYEKFVSEYKDKERDYDISDYCPETGIICMDDGCWGRGDILWRPYLYGNPELKYDKYSKEWLKALRLITHKETSRSCICWDSIHPWSLRKHRSFTSMNGTAVFDETANKEVLSSLKLCFLCGRYITPETLKAVDELVKENGLTVVSPKRFAPDYVKNKVTCGVCEIKSQKGRWIISSSPCNRKVETLIKDYLGKKGEITLPFKNGKTVLSISKDGNGIKKIN